MRSVNKVILIGNLTRDPEVRQTTTGQKVATFSVATNRYWKDANGNQSEDTEYHDTVAWGKLAEICEAYLKSGTAVYLEGRLKTRSWEGNDGNKRYKTEIIIAELNILSRKKDDIAGGMPINDSSNDLDTNSAKSEPSLDDTTSSNDEKINIEDIPF